MKRVLLGILSVAIFACSADKKPDEQAFLESLEKQKEVGPTISNEVLESILQQIPSPLEVSVLLKESGTKYDVSILNSTDNISKYNSNFEKALNLRTKPGCHFLPECYQRISRWTEYRTVL